MIANGRLLALITARGGSKRLPMKNLLKLAGKPMIAWSIEAGLGSKYVDRVVVTTDDEDIAEVSKKFGADVPFLRPKKLAADTSPSIDTIRHAVSKLEEFGDQYEYLLLLQPTSPLRTTLHINEAVELLIKKNASGIVGVCRVDHPVECVNELPDDLSMKFFINDKCKKLRSQDYPKKFKINGAIYLCKISQMFREDSVILIKDCFAYKMKPENSVDIDNKFDFCVADFVMSNQLLRQ